MGALTGGTLNGIASKMNGNSFWTGNVPGAQSSAIASVDDVLRLEAPKPKIAPLEASKIQPKELPIDNVSSSLKRIDPKGDAIQFVTDGAAKGVVQVEQYALRAAEDGFYPVMKRGFVNPKELSWLNKDEVWKFGTTKNPLTRYSQSLIDNTGACLRYSTEFSGTLKQATTLERMKILNFRWQNGFLPAGNKIVR